MHMHLCMCTQACVHEGQDTDFKSRFWLKFFFFNSIHSDLSVNLVNLLVTRSHLMITILPKTRIRLWRFECN